MSKCQICNENVAIVYTTRMEDNKPISEDWFKCALEKTLWTSSFIKQIWYQ